MSRPSSPDISTLHKSCELGYYQPPNGSGATERGHVLPVSQAMLRDGGYKSYSLEVMWGLERQDPDISLEQWL